MVMHDVFSILNPILVSNSLTIYAMILGGSKKDPYPTQRKFLSSREGGNRVTNVLNLYRMSAQNEGGIVNFLRGEGVWIFSGMTHCRL